MNFYMKAVCKMHTMKVSYSRVPTEVLTLLQHNLYKNSTNMPAVLVLGLEHAVRHTLPAVFCRSVRL